jgi:protein disulfide-isomerase A6
MPTFVKRAASSAEVEALREKVRVRAKGYVEFRATWTTDLLPTRAGFNSLSSSSQAKSKPISLLFTSASKVTPLYKALSTDFYRQLDFFAARDSKVGQETMRAFGVDKVPALVVLHGDEVAKYDGASSRSRERVLWSSTPRTNDVAGGGGIMDRSAQVREDPCFPGTVCGGSFSIRRQSCS